MIVVFFRRHWNGTIKDFLNASSAVKLHSEEEKTLRFKEIFSFGLSCAGCFILVNQKRTTTRKIGKETVGRH